ncbi:hypothetical protein B0I35DRAFT_260893 [Stachybotrys elegans]|uniref:Secreted protein n=1 Tax=Stachybotrys elegans TaxID=80388 RepID=A0A8K0WPP5_9HYPO|nr:hypothetical protein B0I35DRAFT_260893 [Stachybotrys elegans]
MIRHATPVMIYAATLPSLATLLAVRPGANRCGYGPGPVAALDQPKMAGSRYVYRGRPTLAASRAASLHAPRNGHACAARLPLHVHSSRLALVMPSHLMPRGPQPRLPISFCLHVWDLIRAI